jgi:hypothetical protein
MGWPPFESNIVLILCESVFHVIELMSHFKLLHFGNDIFCIIQEVGHAPKLRS